MKPLLFQFAKNIYSQNGEDGIIEKIFDIIKPKSKVCIEFGAWDGFHLSNTARLWADKADPWKAVLIEGDAEKYKDLVENVKDYNCICINAYVGQGDDHSLESLLKKDSITDPIDLLSIDIDGDDYYIFSSLKEIKPRVIICEYNSTFPAHLEMIPAYGKGIGCSPAALVKVAEEKGYQLVAITVSNCIFVKNDEFHHFSEFETNLDMIALNTHVSYIITDFQGNYLLVNETVFPYGIKNPLNQEDLFVKKRFKIIV